MDTISRVEKEYLPISYLAEYFYCERSCFYYFASADSNEFQDVNYLQGRITHESVDKYSKRYRIHASNYWKETVLFNSDSINSLRSLKQVTGLHIKSDKYKLFGKTDLVEFSGNIVIPVEFKKKVDMKNINLKAQLLLQSLCLEEMFQTKISNAFLYSFKEKRRYKVELQQRDKEEIISKLETIRSKLKNFDPMGFKQIKNVACKKCIFLDPCMPENLVR